MLSALFLADTAARWFTRYDSFLIGEALMLILVIFMLNDERVVCSACHAHLVKEIGADWR